jgi:prepilin-type N-terminal cleavage/methylation domain-containing protein
MKTMARKNKNAFTLIELLVVVSIIALLIGIALPSFNRAKIQAKVVDSRQLISNIESAIESFRAERALGGRVPPSSSDADGSGVAVDTYIDPLDSSGSAVPSTGASLLVLALAGPDNRGTVGFRPDGAAATWADSIGGAGSGGLYDTNLGTRSIPAPRYGPFAGATAMKRISSIQDIRKKGFLAPNFSGHLGEQKVFADLFNSPILYYKARKAARQMLTVGASVGIYDHNDNVALTSFAGSDHVIANPFPVPPHPGYMSPADSFDSFIIDRKASGCDENNPAICVQNPPIPYRPQDFLLIAAGPDGKWGTKDDVTNWK